MKKIFFIGLLCHGIAFGQYFETADESRQPEETGFFSDVTDTDMGTYPGNPPDQGEDAFGPGNPGSQGPRLPIDQWWWVLPLAGMALGYRFLKSKAKETNL